MFFRTKKIVLSAVIALAVFLPSQILAATLWVRPATSIYLLGSTFGVEVVVDSTDQALNAVSGQLTFPTALLEVISISKANSILNYWVKEPVSGVGLIEFEGIVPNPGFRGSGGRILTINFRAKQLGQAALTFTTGSALANDGAGTNILEHFQGASFTLHALPPVPVVPPVNLKLPAAPNIISRTHSDPDQWYSQKEAEFSWLLKSDITGVNILANQEPGTDPGSVSDGLFSTYEYQDLTDGSRYLHVKFRNASGWGPTSHFKFNIDTIPPEGLTAILATRSTTTDPRISLQISATDALSGLDQYTIQTNDLSPVVWADDGGMYSLTLPSVGEHKLIVSAFDLAGNVASTTLTTLVEPPPLVVVAGEDLVKIKLTPELLLVILVGGGLFFLLIIIGLAIALDKHHWSRVFNYLRLEKTHQIDILELAKTRRELTAEETLLLEKLKSERSELSKLL